MIARARARTGVQDLGGWVVRALRALPEAVEQPATTTECPPSASPIYHHPSLTLEQRERWLRRFRATTYPYEQRAVLARLAQEHPDERPHHAM